MLCFTYSRVQLQQHGKIVTMMQFALLFLHITTLGEYVIEDLDIYIFVQNIVFSRLISFRLETQSFV